MTPSARPRYDVPPVATATPVSGRADRSARFASFDGAPGYGALTVALSGGQSRVTRAYAASPLRLLTPKNHGRASWIFTSTFGGGLVGGDAVFLEIDVDDGAKAYLSTQAATKVYRSARETTVQLHARIERDATLVVVPDPVMCFAGSSYRQQQHVDLHDAGNLVFVDWLSSGRHAAGERWQFDRYESRTVIERGGRRVVHDALLLSPEHGSLADRMGRFEVLLVAIVTGPAVASAASDVLARIDGLPLDRRGRSIVGASPIDGGCLVRIAGTSVEETGSTLRALLGFVPALLGDDPWARKW
jgi:urease accessory protein